MIERILTLAIIAVAVFVPLNAFAAEMSVTAQKEIFGPNDWIEIFVKIEKYSGGEVSWEILKPDGSTESGEDSARYGKLNHIIPRNAYDDQFGEWAITYSYKDITKSITITVEPLIIEASTDKATYFPHDKLVLRLGTNYFEPKAHLSEDYVIQIFDESGNAANSLDELRLGAISDVTLKEFSVYEILENFGSGTYTAQIQYFNVIQEISFEILE